MKKTNKKKRKILKTVLTVLLIFLIMTGSCVLYAFKIEPYRIKTNDYTMGKKKADLRPIKIVQFSDVHIKEDFTYESFEKIVSAINKQNPDIVVFTGDLYDNYAKYNDDKNMIGQLEKIEAKYAKIAIWGNRDVGGGAVRQYQTIMEQSGFTVLKNQNWYVTVADGKKILFTGLDDSMLGNPSMPNDTKIYDSDYDILLTHEPDVVNDFQNDHYHLTLSGHSHGGQINIPFIPIINENAISTTSLSKKYTRGLYSLDASGEEKIYVNTGIGTTHISARFGVIPEISVCYIYL